MRYFSQLFPTSQQEAALMLGLAKQLKQASILLVPFPILPNTPARF
jgi:hypothetical protein